MKVCSTSVKRKNDSSYNNCYYFQTTFCFLTLFLLLLSKIKTTKQLLISNSFVNRMIQQNYSEDLYHNEERSKNGKLSEALHNGFAFEEYNHIETYRTVENRFQVCRFHNACTLRDGKLLLHPSWENDEKWIRQQCHIASVGYLDHFDKQRPPHKFFNYDLLGAVSISRLQGRSIVHQPHFVQRFLPAYFAVNMLHNFSLQPLPEPQCTLPHGQTCSSQFFHDLYPFNLSIIVPSAVWIMRKLDWIPQFLNLLPGSPTVLPASTFQGLDYQCFKSIFLFPPRSPVLQNSLFSMSEPKEDINFHNNSDKFLSVRLPRRKCNVGIVIINRNTARNRNFKNLGEMKIFISKKLFASRLSLSNVNPTVYVTEFENNSFSEQKRIVNMADIIIGPHGAGLTNIVFARRGTPFLEVFPYLYYYNLFQQFARIFSLNYSYSVAAPDSLSFFNCVKGKAIHSSNPNLLADAKKIWKNVEQVYREDPNPLKKQKVSHSCRDGLKIRHCVRDQSLYVNVAHIADWVLTSVKQICG